MNLCHHSRVLNRGSRTAWTTKYTFTVHSKTPYSNLSGLVNELFFNEPLSTRPSKWRVSALVTKQEKKISEKKREDKRLTIHLKIQ
jgi:hypothetical protein